MTQTWTQRWGFALAWTCCTIGLVHAPAHAQAQPTAQTAAGALIGVVQGGATQFRGIPYAEPPVGDLRWAAPRTAKPWAGVRDATRFGAACPQVPDPFGGSLATSEDCLSLNVYVPSGSNGRQLPVIVWIPGGGYVIGAGSQYDASHLAQATQAVVVTMNYRLGALGWLWSSGMATERKGHNFALQDQQEAMRWVKRHIGAFQGDPSRITMVGHSVGSIAASLHLASPTAAGLFHRAILLSGISPSGMLNSDQAAQVGDAFATKVGCPAGAGQMACLRALTPEALVAASPSYEDIGRSGLPWQSFIDGELVTGDVFTALSRGEFNKVPVMVGSTLDEGRGFVPISFHRDGTPMTQDEYVAAAGRFFGPQVQPLLTGVMYPSGKLGSPAHAWSQVLTDGWFACQANEVAKRASRHVPVYTYEFADRAAPEFERDPFLPSGAFHAGDLLYWFQTPIAGAPLVLDPAQKRLSDQMVGYWGRFAQSGQPNDPAGGHPVWPRYNALSTPYLTLMPDAIRTQEWGAFQRAHQCGTWSLLYGLRSLLGAP